MHRDFGNSFSAATRHIRGAQGSPHARSLGPNAPTMVMEVGAPPAGSPPPPPQPQAAGVGDVAVERALAYARGHYWTADAELRRCLAGTGCAQTAEQSLIRARTSLGEALKLVYRCICAHSVELTLAAAPRLASLRAALEDLDGKRREVTDRLGTLRKPR